ncbi:MAG: hypothetical protein LBE91_14495 [Tannerella sp.]|jgi:hypothetical protein|nr:hypothetical protein [Tannerella sp.]
MKNLIERKEYLGKLLSYKDKDIIKVVTGLRRSSEPLRYPYLRQAAAMFCAICEGAVDNKV